MRELALNDACGNRPFPSVDDACEAIVSISLGIAQLVEAKVAKKVLRLAKPVTDIPLSDGASLFDIMLRLSKSAGTKDQGIFLQSIAQKVPLEDALEDACFERLATWSLTDYPDCLALLLCTASSRIAVSASEEAIWHRPFLEVSCKKGADVEPEVFSIPNIFSDDVADVQSDAVLSDIGSKSPNEVWDDRENLFPNLQLVPSVQSNLHALETLQFKLAVEKLVQLQTSAASWGLRPGYVLDVRPESEATMNKHGRLRQFRDNAGHTQTYALHSTVSDGYRIHFREVGEAQRIEIGYIGPHLKVARRN